MQPSTKKSLVITGVVAAAVGAPLALTLIPYGIQNKDPYRLQVAINRTLIDDYKRNEAAFGIKYKSTKDDISKKQEELGKLQEKSKKTEEDNKRITLLNQEISELSSKYENAILEELLPFLEKIALLGNSKLAKEIVNYTALYIVNKHKAFKQELEKFGQEVDLHYPSKEETQKISEFYKKWIDELNKIKKDNLNITSTAWVSGLKNEWDIAKDLYSSQLRLIGGFYEWGTALTYPANSFYKTLNSIKGKTATKVLKNLREGIKEDVVLSKVVIKNNINFFLQNFYSNELKDFINSQKNEQSVLEIIESSKTVDAETKAFHKFYVTEYYNAAKHGVGEDLKELKVLKENKHNEVDNTLKIVLDNGTEKEIYGLGYTQKDLEAKNVGLSAIKGSKTTTGKRLYDAILKMSTTSDNTSQQVFDSGYKTTKTALENMKAIAKAVAKLITGNETSEWHPRIKYNDKGISGQVKEIEVKIRDKKGNINITEFNKWLNQEQFFFGREGQNYYKEQKIKELDEDKNLKEAQGKLKESGYESLKKSDNKYGTITNKQFYYGALEAFKAYYQFRDTTINEGYSYFPKKVPNYDIKTYNFSERETSGVGAYDGLFIFNSDPYYGLPKWSVTSFANHESVMGHHNQIVYAKQFLKTVDGFTIGNIFDYTSYTEGWALFMEWFGIEAGLYGEPNFDSEDYYALPKSFKNAKGITSFIKAKTKDQVTSEEIKKMKELHAGVYWNLVNQENWNMMDDKERTLKAAELTNMLQYYGALNEAQLRNMRRAVDTAYHGDVKGESDLPKNASIKDVRDFLRNNSALGVGDITAESKRYLNLPGQSTSYNHGKEEMLKLYDRVRKSKNLSRKDFVSNKENIKEFLNLILETGALPIETLKEIVGLHYNLKK